MQPYLSATVSASAVRTNLRLFREHIGPGVMLCPSVKSNGYGHGIDLLLDEITRQSDWLAVACPSEAIHLRQLGYRGPLLAFFSACAYDAATRRDAIAELLAADVTQTVVNEWEVGLLADAARQQGRPAHVHLAVDTGMGRCGISADEAAELAARINREPGLTLTGIYTHFATADETDATFTRRQFSLFMRTVAACDPAHALIRHAANSAALIDFPDTHLDMVRPGISVYGYQPSDAMRTRLPLRPALRLTGPLLHVKRVPAGSACGYGLTHRFDRPSRIGRVPIGYGDGYARGLSNQATVRIRNQDAPVRGRVSMDQIVIDLTDIPAASEGDEVEIVSPDPAAPHSVENLARLAGTIPYEVTCRLGGPRIGRTLID